MIKIDASQLNISARLLEKAQRQVNYAARTALNTVAFKTQTDGRAHIEAALHMPTRWTTTSWRVRQKATKDSLLAVVGWSDYLASKRTAPGEQYPAPHYYLAQHWGGGERKFKAYERHMHRTGILPAGMFTVPGEAAKDLGMIDARGNFKGGQIVKIMSALGGMDELGYKSNATTKQSKRKRKSAMFWVGRPSDTLPLGIWWLDENGAPGKQIRPVMIFVDHVSYRRRLNLYKIEQNSARMLQSEFNSNVERAIKVALDKGWLKR